MSWGRGELVTVNFDPTVGHEPRKRRPAVVLSVREFNDEYSSLVVVCPVTSNPRNHAYHVPLPDDAPVQGRICLEQMRAIDPEAPSRDMRSLGWFLDFETMDVVLTGIGTIFGI